MKKIYQEPMLEIAILENDVILTSIAKMGDEDPYMNDRDWGVLL